MTHAIPRVTVQFKAAHPPKCLLCSVFHWTENEVVDSGLHSTHFIFAKIYSVHTPVPNGLSFPLLCTGISM